VDEIIRNERRAPAAGPAENAFKNRLVAELTQMAKIVGLLEEAYDDLKAAESMKEGAPPRWQANYDYVRARMEEQMAYLEEYEGQMGPDAQGVPDPRPGHPRRLEAGLEGKGQRRRGARNSTAAPARSSPTWPRLTPARPGRCSPSARS